MATIIAVSAMVVACGSLHRTHVVAVGEQLPPLTFVALDGSAAPLKPAPGRVTFVNVFATWCPPCKAETPDLAAFAAASAAKGVDVIGIDQQENATQVVRFRAEYHIGYPMLIETGKETKDILGARIIPHTIVVDGSGVIRSIVSGPMTRAQMDALAASAAVAKP